MQCNNNQSQCLYIFGKLWTMQINITHKHKYKQHLGFSLLSVYIFYDDNLLRCQEEQGRCRWCEHSLPTNVAQLDSQTQRHVWVEFVVGYPPCTEGFLIRFSVFSPYSKTNISKSGLYWEHCMKSHTLEMPLEIPIYYFIL